MLAPAARMVLMTRAPEVRVLRRKRDEGGAGTARLVTPVTMPTMAMAAVVVVVVVALRRKLRVVRLRPSMVALRAQVRMALRLVAAVAVGKRRVAALLVTAQATRRVKAVMVEVINLGLRDAP